MRTAFITTLLELAAADPKITLLTGDLGYGVLEPFAKERPKQFINLGVAEQNLMGFAAGLALAGRTPICYSIATFLTLRAFEQVRNDICYQNLNVKLVGVGSGLTYSQYGATHHSMEDIGLMRLLPNMTVIAPGDPHEVMAATRAMLQHRGPCYLRIASRGEPNVHAQPPAFAIGRGIVIREGTDAALIAAGNLLQNAALAAQQLAAEGINVRLISMPSIKPLDVELVTETAQRFAHVFTIEEHSEIGGLGSAVAAVVAQLPNCSSQLHIIAGPDAFQPVGGWLNYMRDRNGLTPEKVAERIMKTLRQ